MISKIFYKIVSSVHSKTGESTIVLVTKIPSYFKVPQAVSPLKGLNERDLNLISVLLTQRAFRTLFFHEYLETLWSRDVF